jgi:hypothetical protein
MKKLLRQNSIILKESPSSKVTYKRIEDLPIEDQERIRNYGPPKKEVKDFEPRGGKRR